MGYRKNAEEDFGSGKEELRADWRKFHIEKLDEFCLSDIIRVSNTSTNKVNRFVYNCAPKFVYLVGSIV